MNQQDRDNVISLHEHLDLQIKALNKRIDDSDRALRDHITSQVEQIKAALSSAQRENTLTAHAQDKAVDKALDAQKEQAEGHNDLLRKMEKLIDTFPTKEETSLRFGRIERFQAMLTGGLILTSVIGVANLVRLFNQ